MRKKKSLLKLIAVSLGALHCVNKMIDSTSIVNTAVRASGKYYHWKNGDLFYRVIGHGKPLLLLHDLNVFSSNYEWSAVISRLSENYTVYALDLIGCGRSDKPAITYTNYFYVQLVTDFVKNVIKEKCRVAATGLSGSFVLMADTLDEEMFDSLILINPKSIGELNRTPDERSRLLMRLFDLPIIGKTAYYIAVGHSNTEYYLSERCYYNPFELKNDSIKAYYDAAHAGNGNGKYLLASLAGNYVNANITNALKNSSKPILLINGAERHHADEIALSYKKWNDRIDSYLIEGANQLPQLEKPDETLRILLS